MAIVNMTNTAKTNEPAYVSVARKYIGQKEIPGVKSNSWIESIWRNIDALAVFATGQYDDSRVPWCGAFLAEVMKEIGYFIPPQPYRAKSWLEWGVPVTHAMHGAVVVFARVGGAHVGICVGKNKDGTINVLGGNQKDSVCIESFPLTNVIGFRAPYNTQLAELQLGSKAPTNTSQV
jgi:uncharacterized protein (TIGR02594 family)